MKKILLLALTMIVTSAVFANIAQSNWRWRNNDGTETTATWKTTEDSAITINNYKPLRLRIEIDNGLSDSKSFSRNLQYALSPGGPWYTISDKTNINAFIYTGSNGYVQNGEPTTKQLSAGNYTFVPGSMVTNAGTYSDTLTLGTGREYEWCIQPTRNIQPLTTYYFKASDGDAPPVLPSLTTGNTFTGTPILLSNGSFEDSLKDWTTIVKNGSTASFSVIQSTYHTGANALKVAVGNVKKYDSLALVHKAINLDKPGVFLLRFWAVADQRNALLTVNAKSSKGNDTFQYQIYNRFDTASNQWQMYEYAFTAPKGMLSVQIRFNTKTNYYLDDIELISALNATEDIATQYRWQHNQIGYGWLSGDNDNSVLLPDSSVAWIFSDSFLGFPLPHSNVIGSGPIVNNVIVHEVNNQYTSVYKGTSSSPQSLFSPGNGNIFWNSGGVVEGDSLRVMLMEIKNGGTYNSTYVGTLSLPDLKVTGQVKTSYTGSNAPNTIFTDGGYHYIYISERVGTFENYSQVARVPVGSLSSTTTQWEFYTNDNTWSTDYSQAKRIVAGVEAASVVKLGENNYVMSGVPNLSNEVAVWFAPSPTGPWVNKTVLYYIPGEEGVLPYEGHIDKGSGKDGIYTLAYSVYPFSGLVPQQLADKGSYIPYYIKANLLALSPFTTLKSEAGLSQLFVTKEGSKARISWASNAVINNSKFEVYRSTDSKNWQSLQTVSGSNSLFEVYDNNPANGINYYKVEQQNGSGNKELGIKAIVFQPDNAPKVTLQKNPTAAFDIAFSIQNYEAGKVTATLINLEGKIICREEFSVSAKTTLHTLTNNKQLTKGMYMLIIQGKDIFSSHKVVIE